MKKKHSPILYKKKNKTSDFRCQTLPARNASVRNFSVCHDCRCWQGVPGPALIGDSMPRMRTYPSHRPAVKRGYPWQSSVQSISPAAIGRRALISVRALRPGTKSAPVFRLHSRLHLPNGGGLYHPHEILVS